MCHRQFFDVANAIKESRGKKPCMGKEPELLMLLLTVTIARTKCEMWKGESKAGNGDLCSDKDHAITSSCDGSTALSNKRQGRSRRGALGTQELGSRVKLLLFTCLPKHLATRLDFALFLVLLLLLSQILQFWGTRCGWLETAL